VSPLLKAFCQRLNGPKKAESTLTSKKAVLTERERGRGREKKGREREKGRRERKSEERECHETKSKFPSSVFYLVNLAQAAKATRTQHRKETHFYIFRRRKKVCLSFEELCWFVLTACPCSPGSPTRSRDGWQRRRATPNSTQQKKSTLTQCRSRNRW
jgi:hypothetical protein